MTKVCEDASEGARLPWESEVDKEGRLAPVSVELPWREAYWADTPVEDGGSGKSSTAGGLRTVSLSRLRASPFWTRVLSSKEGTFALPLLAPLAPES